MNARAKKTAALFLIPLLMFGFGYLLVPIYDVFCDLTGLNGKTGTISATEATRLAPDRTRMVEVEFMASLNQNAPLDFAPAVKRMRVHPGQTYHAAYHARNRQAQAMVGQAVPSVSPAKAARYFNKTECFCFNQQAFAPGERRELPLIFVIDPDLPKDIKTITLSYTFFEVDGADVAGGEGEHDHEHDHDHAGHDHKVRVEG